MARKTSSAKTLKRIDLSIPQRYQDYLRVGTCSWKYDSWKGLIYESDVDYEPDDYLLEYARHLRTVEIDQWFWSLLPSGLKLPEIATVHAYADSVPADFLFTLKAPNVLTLTHYYPQQPEIYAQFANRPNPNFLNPKLLLRFLETLQPMEGRIGAVLFQFEYMNRNKMPSVDAFLERLDAFFSEAPKEYPYAVEIRNRNYLCDNFFKLLRKHKLGYIFLDGYFMPPIGNIFETYDTFTAPLSVIRLLGPNHQELDERTGKVWNQIVEPKPDGLEATARIIRANAKRKILTFVNVNNHYEGCAPLTISRLLDILREDR